MQLGATLERIRRAEPFFQVQAFRMQHRQPGQQLRIEPVGLGVLGIVIAQVGRPFRRHQNDPCPFATEPRRQRHPRVTSWFHHHQHLRGIGAVGQHCPQLGEIARRGAEPTTGPQKPALIVGQADLMGGPTRDVNAQTQWHFEPLLVNDSDLTDRRLPRENDQHRTLANRGSAARPADGRQVPNRAALLRQRPRPPT